MSARALAAVLLLAAPLAASAAPATATAEIPARPQDVKFKELKYDAPNRNDYRHVLSNGVVVYIVEDHGLPLVDVTVTARGGDYMDPAGKLGLSGIVADQMRSGGAGDMDAAKFDEELDFRAVEMAIGSGPRESTASVNVLSKDLDAGLDLLFAAMKSPRFQQDRIDLYKTQAKQNLEHRNDSTTSIENREWKRLIYGPEHFEALQPTTTTLDAITRDDMVAFQKKVWNPSNFIVAVSGDVKAADALAKLESRFKGWAKGDASPPAPKPGKDPEGGIWIVDKPDVNQSRVSFGHLATTYDDPRLPTLDVMNEILGGGGFTSYLVQRIRSDEGLAYSTGSVVGSGREYPKSFRALFQSKNQSVARALSIGIEQLERLRKEPPPAEALDTNKQGIVQAFPQRFSSAQAKAAIFVDDELIGRPADFWATYRDKIKAVTAADVQKTASEFLHPDKLTILVVGKREEVMAGEADHPDFTLQKLAGTKGVRDIPLPDPGTLVYPPVKPPAGT